MRLVGRRGAQGRRVKGLDPKDGGSAVERKRPEGERLGRDFFQLLGLIGTNGGLLWANVAARGKEISR